MILRRLNGLCDIDKARSVLEKLRYGGAVRLEDFPIQNPTEAIKKRELLEKFGPDHSFQAYLLSALFKDKIIRALLPSVSVVCDRGVCSVIAKHSALGANIDSVNLANFPILEPDVTILLTIDEEERRKRINSRGNPDESDKLQKNKGGLLDVMEMKFDYLIDFKINTTDLSVDDIQQIVFDQIDEVRKRKFKKNLQ